METKMHLDSADPEMGHYSGKWDCCHHLAGMLQAIRGALFIKIQENTDKVCRDVAIQSFLQKMSCNLLTQHV